MDYAASLSTVDLDYSRVSVLVWGRGFCAGPGYIRRVSEIYDLIFNFRGFKGKFYTGYRSWSSLPLPGQQEIP